MSRLIAFCLVAAISLSWFSIPPRHSIAAPQDSPSVATREIKPVKKEGTERYIITVVEYRLAGFIPVDFTEAEALWPKPSEGLRT